MRGLIAAIGLFTRLPSSRIAWRPEDMADAMRWCPAVGGLIGLLVAGGAWLGMRVDGWTGALAALVLWVVVTGALHLDGLGDVADGAGAAHGDPARLRAAMADPHVGSFATVAITLQIVAKLVLLHALLDRGSPWLIIPIPFAARIGPLLWARWLPPLHPGLGSRLGAGVRLTDIGGWTVPWLAAAVAAPALLAMPLLAAAWGWWLRARLGGISGDGHGAGIELVETGLLLASILCAGHV